MAVFLGIDGGGTRTTAWLADESGKVLARAVAGPSNPLKVGVEACQRELLRAARAAVTPVYDRRLARRGTKPNRKLRRKGQRLSELRLDVVALGLAGTDRKPLYRALLSWLRKSIPARHHLLTSDAAIALRAAVGNSPGVVVISGTGSIAYARDERGRVERAGGWGTLYDDAGSGYDLGRRAVAAALRAFDGRGPRTNLLASVRASLGLKDITQVVLKPLAPNAMAALFPLVVKAADRRDRVAKDLCTQAGRDLAELALALIRRLRWRHGVVPVVCAGGVFRSSAGIRRSFSSSLRRGAPHARVMLLTREPVEGALALAREKFEAARAAISAPRSQAARASAQERSRRR